jgi:DNA-binding NarL/FixJ family response regulator
MRIIVATTFVIVRRGMEHIINSVNGWSVVADPSSQPELLDALRAHRVDVLVLGTWLRDRSAMDIVAQVRSQWPDLPMLVLGTDPRADDAIGLLRAGASGYVTRENSAEEFLDAIRKVGTGGRYVTPEVAELMLDRVTRGDKRPHEHLSARELEVFRLIAMGRSPTEIAKALDLSIKTVSTYRRRILDKTGLRTNADLVRYAVSLGIV